MCRSGTKECQDVHEPVLRKRYGGGCQVEGGENCSEQVDHDACLCCTLRITRTACRVVGAAYHCSRHASRPPVLQFCRTARSSRPSCKLAPKVPQKKRSTPTSRQFRRTPTSQISSAPSQKHRVPQIHTRSTCGDSCTSSCPIIHTPEYIGCLLCKNKTQTCVCAPSSPPVPRAFQDIERALCDEMETGLCYFVV